MQNFVDTYRSFPSGGDGYFPQIENYVSGGTPFGPKKQGLGWAYQLLPYLEQGALKAILTNQQLQETPVELYICPSRRGVTLVDPYNLNALVALTEYAAATPCTTRRAGSSSRYDPRDSLSGAGSPGYIRNRGSFSQGSSSLTGAGGTAPPKDRDWDGIIVRTPWQSALDPTNPNGGAVVPGVPGPVRMAQITDGTSNTLVVGEKYIRTYLYPGGTLSDDRGWSDGWDPDTMRSTCFPPLGDGDPEGFSSEYYGRLASNPSNDKAVMHFGSAHPSGFNTVFADGSVHSINYDIDIVLFNNLGTRNDGNVTDLGAL
jgi:prepilin-type processing-associated H-X9-DG protein